MKLTASLRTSPTPSMRTNVDLVLFKWAAIVRTEWKHQNGRIYYLALFSSKYTTKTRIFIVHSILDEGI